jgi:hypothetical protein
VKAVKGWQPDGTGVQPAGDIGGDIQAGDSYSVRFVNPGLPHAIITYTAYPAGESGPDSADFYVQAEIESLICEDPADPGSTETWSEVEYHRPDDEAWYGTVTEAEEAARRAAARYLEYAGYLDWNGEPFTTGGSL